MAQTQNDLHIQRYTDASAFSLLRPFWNLLLRKSPVDDPFLTWEWQSLWWKHYGAGYKLWLLSAWENEKSVGILPLILSEKIKRGVKARTLLFLGDGANDHSGLIIPEDRGDVARAFGKFLVAHDHEWDILRLNNFLEGGQDLQPFWDEFPKHEFIHEKCERSAHLFLTLDQMVNDYPKRLPDRMQREIKERMERVNNSLMGQFVNISGQRSITQEFDELLETALLGRYSHLYFSETDRQFQRDLFSRMGSNGWLGVNFLYIDGRVIAYNYGFIYRNKYFGWRMGYDPQFSKLSPGSLLLLKTIEYCSTIGIEEIDFLRGDSLYKRQWASQFRTYFNFRIIRRWRLSELFFHRLPGWKERLIQRFGNRYGNDADSSLDAS